MSKRWVGVVKQEETLHGAIFPEFSVKMWPSDVVLKQENKSKKKIYISILKVQSFTSTFANHLHFGFI